MRTNPDKPHRTPAGATHGHLKTSKDFWTESTPRGGSSKCCDLQEGSQSPAGAAQEFCVRARQCGKAKERMGGSVWEQNPAVLTPRGLDPFKALN